MPSHNMISFLVFGLLFATNLRLSDAQIGVFYGQNGNNLPTPAEVAGIIASNKISKVRLLQPNKDILTALKGKDIEVLLGMSNTDVQNIAGDDNKTYALQLAEEWLLENVKPYVPGVKIKYIVSGNDLSPNDANNGFIFANVGTLPLLHNALQKLGLTDIKVTTLLDFSILSQVKESMPLPSTAKLFPNSQEYISDVIIQNITKYGGPLMVSINPYYELIKHQDLKPEYALFTAKDGGVKDGKYTYENMFDVMLDSLYTALEKLTNMPADMEIIVSETGRPSAGGVQASIENEKTYVTNLVKHVNKGTPMRPNKPVQVYLNMFDENQKGKSDLEEDHFGELPEIEKHFGVFSSDGKLKFPVTFAPSA